MFLILVVHLLFSIRTNQLEVEIQYALGQVKKKMVSVLFSELNFMVSREVFILFYFLFWSGSFDTKIQ